jgi:hypothetical protein
LDKIETQAEFASDDNSEDLRRELTTLAWLRSENRMAAATRFVIDEDASCGPRCSIALTAVRKAASCLPWLEFAVLIPSKLLGVLGWLAIPLFIFAVVPVVLLGTLLIAQAPVFFLMWKLFGSNAPIGEDAGRDTSPT